MKERPLGRTGLRVSEVGFGAWAIGGNEFGNSYGPTDDRESIAAVRRALELGCTFFDTADVYGHGHSEEVLGAALEGHPEALVATKVGGDFYHGAPRLNFEPDYVRFAAEKSRARLRREVIDLYQLHNPDEGQIGDPGLYAVLDELREEGVIRCYGVSVHTPQEALLAIACGKPAVLQLPFSALRQEWVEEVFPAARKANVGVVAREPLGNGFLAGKRRATDAFARGDIRSHWPLAMRRAFETAGQELARVAGPRRTAAQAALRFVLAHPEVSTTIPGCKTAAQAEENMAASDAPALTPEERAGLEAWAR